MTTVFTTTEAKESDMSFIQIIEFRTSDIEAVRKIDDEWEEATEDKRTARRAILTRDRNEPNRYFQVVFFDSYESAMENSNLPETQALSEKFQSVVDGDLRFYDLDVVEERS